MAPKRPSPLEQPPSASSSEEEEVSDEELASVEGESDADDPEQMEEDTPIKASVPAPVKRHESEKKSSSEVEDGSDSGSEYETDPEPEPEPESKDAPVSVANPNVSPVASKPVFDISKVKKARTKAGNVRLPTVETPTKAVGKRATESTGEEKNAKRAKSKVTSDQEQKPNDESKKPLFKMHWSEDEEIVVLKGMVDYMTKEGADPYADCNAFHEFIKKSLHVDVTKTRLMDKVRRLKKKFRTNEEKFENGEECTFATAHDKKIYDLSKKIWGSDAINGGINLSKTNGKARKAPQKHVTPNEKEPLLASLRAPKDNTPAAPPPKKDPEEQNVVKSQQVSNESILLNKSIIAGVSNESFMKEGLSLIDDAKKIELQEKWRKLHAAEAEIFLKRVELVHEQTKLVLDAYKGH